MDRILVTGAAGFVGRHLVHRLALSGRQLTLAVRTDGSEVRSIARHLNARLVVTGPLETTYSLDSALDGASTIVHLAGLAHARSPLNTEAAFLAANATGTKILTRTAAEKGVRTFIHLSSLAAVTRNSSSSVVDDRVGDPPHTPYGRSKHEAERHVSALVERGIFSVSLRPPLVVGADARGNWATLQRLAATGLPVPFANVQNRRSLIGIGSLVGAISHLCNHPWPAEKSGGYCIADQEWVSLPGLIAELRRGMNLGPRLFSFPAGLLDAAMRVAGRGHLASALLGDLRVDASRFKQTFGFVQEQALAAAIAESGRLYGQLTRGHLGKNDAERSE